jgi:hypothetical protein
VFENHGLMKRMYGEQRHMSVLRAEMDTNDIEGGVWNRRREESSLNRYDLQPSPPAPTTTTISSSTPTTSTTTNTTTTVQPPTNTTLPETVFTTTVEDGEEDGTDDATDDDPLETTTEAISSTQRTDQVEQPGFFKESSATTENPQKSKGM